MDRRFFIFGGASLALAGCASTPMRPTGPQVPITLVSAFQGRSTGTGHFRVWLTGDERRFTARLNGTLSQRGNRLTVVEDFLYDDGQKDRLTWVFDRTAPGRWSGKREDTVGLAEVIEEDGVVRLTYTADFCSPSGVNRLGFADIIYGTPDGTIINDAVVSRGGFPVAAVRFVIR
jgi:hypothetical protein